MADIGLEIVDGLLIDRTYVDTVEAFIAADRSHDEKKRIGKDWLKVLGDQINQVIEKAELGINSDSAVFLRRRAIQLVLERHRAFSTRFPNTRQGKGALRKAINYAVRLHESQREFDRYMDHLAHGGKQNSRRGKWRDILVYEKRHTISYRPDLPEPEYVSLAELDDRREKEQAAVNKAARKAQVRNFGLFRR